MNTALVRYRSQLTAAQNKLQQITPLTLSAAEEGRSQDAKAEGVAVVKPKAKKTEDDLRNQIDIANARVAALEQLEKTSAEAFEKYNAAQAVVEKQKSNSCAFKRGYQSQQDLDEALQAGEYGSRLELAADLQKAVESTKQGDDDLFKHQGHFSIKIREIFVSILKIFRYNILDRSSKKSAPKYAQTIYKNSEKVEKLRAATGQLAVFSAPPQPEPALPVVDVEPPTSPTI